MYYAQSTLDALCGGIDSDLFVVPLQQAIVQIFRISKLYSPLLDIRLALQEENLLLQKIIFALPTAKYFIRNIVRVLAKVSVGSYKSQISRITFLEMSNGCDYFKGIFIIDFIDQTSHKIIYIWQWTAYMDGIDFDKFRDYEIEISPLIDI